MTLPALPLPRVRRVVRWWLNTLNHLLPGRGATADQMVWAAVAAGRRSPVGTTCLATALVAQAIMQQYGFDAKLRIGVRRDGNGAFGAHAWLEQNGAVIVGGPSDMVATYAPLPEMEHLIV